MEPENHWVVEENGLPVWSMPVARWNLSVSSYTCQCRRRHILRRRQPAAEPLTAQKGPLGRTRILGVSQGSP